MVRAFEPQPLKNLEARRNLAVRWEIASSEEFDEDKHGERLNEMLSEMYKKEPQKYTKDRHCAMQMARTQRKKRARLEQEANGEGGSELPVPEPTDLGATVLTEEELAEMFQGGLFDALTSESILMSTGVAQSEQPAAEAQTSGVGQGLPGGDVALGEGPSLVGDEAPAAPIVPGGTTGDVSDLASMMEKMELREKAVAAKEKALEWLMLQTGEKVRIAFNPTRYKIGGKSNAVAAAVVRNLELQHPELQETVECDFESETMPPLIECDSDSDSECD